MRLVFLLATALFAAYEVQAKAVFAHFMLGNTAKFKKHDWKHNIELAREAKIDAFALNIHNGWPYTEDQLDIAFEAANHFSDFKLFISFDYAGNGPWEKAEVTRLINKYKSKKGHYQYNSKPFVSTFEGPDRADDWVDIKADTGCFFIPDWSSRGAFGAINLANQVVDGLFSWAGWPWGNQKMDTYTDASYNFALGQFEAFEYGKAPYNYVKDMPHDGWRKRLSWLIDLYKKGTASSSEESVVVAYRRTLRNICGTGNTTLNIATQLQYEFLPAESLEDHPKRTTSFKDWDYTPQGGIGLHHVALPISDLALFTSSSGFKVTVSSPKPGPGNGTSKSTAQRRTTHPSLPKAIKLSLPPVLKTCHQSATNWNAYVSSTSHHVSKPFSPSSPLSTQVCTSGWGCNSLNPICTLTCAYGYCPPSACVCSSLGSPPTLPKDGGRPVPGYPSTGDPNLSGLCKFVCSTLGSKYCAKMESLSICSTTHQPEKIPVLSPSQPSFCKGKSDGNGIYGELCTYTCKHGFCPRLICECTATVGFPEQPAWIGGGGHGNVTGAERTDQGLCDYACNRGFCPSNSCSSGW